MVGERDDLEEKLMKRFVRVLSLLVAIVLPVAASAQALYSARGASDVVAIDPVSGSPA